MADIPNAATIKNEVDKAIRRSDDGIVGLATQSRPIVMGSLAGVIDGLKSLRTNLNNWLSFDALAGQIIKSVQSGLATGYGDKSIQPVDLDSSILLPIEVYGINTSSQNYTLHGAYLKDSQTVYIPNSTYGDYAWKVIEFNPSIVKSVQRGLQGKLEPSDITEVINVGINSVNPGKCIVIVEGYSSYRGTSTGNQYVYGATGLLTSGTNLRIRMSGRAPTVSWQVLEFI